jgi:hypothetical protein
MPKVLPTKEKAKTSKCPTCRKHLASATALEQHTGTTRKKPKKHVCHKCDEVFCSERAMKQHSDKPSHKTMFECGPCRRFFESKHALAQHEGSPPHARVLAGDKQKEIQDDIDDHARDAMDALAVSLCSYTYTSCSYC